MVGSQNGGKGPRKQNTHYSRDENVDESAKLIEDEPTEIEKELPSNENEPMQNLEDSDKSEPPLFEE